MQSPTDRAYAPLVEHATEVIDGLTDRGAPVTNLLIGGVLGIFLAEVWIVATRPISSVEVLSVGLFGVSPLVGWALSPLLHQGPAHMLVNVLGLVVLGIPLERHWSGKRYVGFVITTGYLSTLIGGALLALLTTDQVAFYGVSGVVYALAGFGVVHLPRQHRPFDSVQWLAMGLSVSAFLTVISDLLTGSYLAPGWINGGHLTGFTIGVLAGWFSWHRRSGD